MRTVTYLITLLFIFTIPFENVVVSTLGSITRILGLLAFASWLVMLIVTNRIRKPNVYIIILSLFILWCGISIFWSPVPQYTLGMFETYVQVLLVTLIIWNVFTSPDQIDSALWAYLLGCFVAAGMILRNFLSGVMFLEGLTLARYAGGGQDPNDLGVMLAIGVPVAVWLGSAVKSTSLLKLIAYLYIPLSIFAILLTASRTALIGLVLSVVFVFMIASRVRLQTRLIVLGVLLISLFYVQSLVPGATFERLGQLDDSVSSGDFEGRGAIWQQGVELFLENPIKGVGSGAFSESISLRRAPHNVFIAISAELGLVGLALFAILYFIVLSTALQHESPEKYLWLSIILIWTVGALTLNWEYRKQTWVLFALTVTSAHTVKSALFSVVKAPPSVLASDALVTLKSK